MTTDGICWRNGERVWVKRLKVDRLLTRGGVRRVFSRVMVCLKAAPIAAGKIPRRQHVRHQDAGVELCKASHGSGKLAGGTCLL